MAFRFTPRRAIKNCKPIHEERVAMNQRRASAVDMVHRVGAGILGIGLLVFAITGLSRGVSWIGSEGQQVLGLSTNGALSVISIVAAVLLIAAALWGGTVSSTSAIAFGGLFLLSGLVHLGLINTSWNPLAFRLSNVLFSLVVGLVLLFLGMYGRVSGGLPPDNPYRRRHPIRKQRPEPDEQLAAGSRAELDEEDQRLTQAEMAMGEGTATPEQEAEVRLDQQRRREAERERAYRNWQRRGATS
jgi:hypothetical protein